MFGNQTRERIWQQEQGYSMNSLRPDCFFLPILMMVNGVTVEDITAVSPTPFPEEDLADYIANLQNVYHNTKWFYAGWLSEGPYAPREITDLDNFTFWPFFREGVVSFDFQVLSNTGQENPAVIYMNPYGEVLRVLFVNAPEDEKGYCDAWGFWDMDW